jgi:hypothetical protein
VVDENGAPQSLHITRANEHDRWSADDLILSIVVARPDPQQVEQHLCADKGYDFEMFMNLSSKNSTGHILNIVVAEMNRPLKNVPSWVRFSILPAAGSLSRSQVG